MIKKTEIHEFLQIEDTIPIVDVRSPAEYQQGHIPNAINIPLFSNDERKEVGTLYRQKGKDASIQRGFELVGPKLVFFIKEVEKISPDKKLRIHCWRGGMRSDSMAWLFSTAGFNVHLLSGGYKVYKNHIRNILAEADNMLILSGKTGSGKTAILHALKETGIQVIDLEGMAHHKGSAFGSLGESEQPSNEQFENDLFHAWTQLNHQKVVILEDESSKIGKVVIPPQFFTRMRRSPVIRIEMDKSLRVERLVTDYANYDADLLIESVEKIRKRLGGQHANAIIEAIQEKDFHSAIDKVLVYYDKTYTYGLYKRENELIHFIETNTMEAEQNAQLIKSWITNSFNKTINSK